MNLQLQYLAANLADLATFRIHIYNQEYQCCKCGNSTRGYTEGIFADDLCGNCNRVGPRGNRHDRRKTIFYTPKTVHVRPPQTHRSRVVCVEDGVRQPQRTHTGFWCVVKIDGSLYVGRNRLNYVALCNTDGTLVREFGLELSQNHLAAIYSVQQQSS